MSLLSQWKSMIILKMCAHSDDRTNVSTFERYPDNQKIFPQAMPDDQTNILDEIPRQPQTYPKIDDRQYPLSIHLDIRPIPPKTNPDDRPISSPIHPRQSTNDRQIFPPIHPRRLTNIPPNPPPTTDKYPPTNPPIWSHIYSIV